MSNVVETATPTDDVVMSDAANETGAREPEVHKTTPKPKQRSEVWTYFKKVKTKPNKWHAVCICKREFLFHKSSPTSTLKRHIETCHKVLTLKGIMRKSAFDYSSRVGKNEGEMVIPEFTGGYNHLKSREFLAKMIMAHELPFMFVEYQGFNLYMKYNNPLHERVSRKTIKNECIKVYDLEKEKMKKVFAKVDRISLTSDCWTSNQTIGYMCITAHFIDADWKLNKRIISFNELSPPHSGEVIAEAIMQSLMDWGIENKIGTITLDNASNNDKAAGILSSIFEERDNLSFLGFFFHVRCCAHVLNLIVQDGVKKIENCIWKIREAVKYLKKSPTRVKNFKEVATQLRITTKRSLCNDVKTRWNSTHSMLQSYKKAFNGYLRRDPNFDWCPTEEEWMNAEKVSKLLEVFVDATSVFSGSFYPTSNLLLWHIFLVKKEICDAYNSSDGFVREMSRAMYEKFEKYWGETSVLVSMASILDPRYKLALIDYCFERLYPSYEVTDRISEVTRKLRTLFEMYASGNATASESGSSSVLGDGSNSSTYVGKGKAKMGEFYAIQRSKMTSSTRKSDLDSYLDEPVDNDESDTFSVLDWWKVNSVKYPVLSKLARGILCIPISTVASESAFSAGGRVLDDYRSSLSIDMVELLVCGGDWIRANLKAEFQTSQIAAKVEENLEISFDDLDIN